MNPFESVYKFMEASGVLDRNENKAKLAALYTGLQIEELLEKLGVFIAPDHPAAIAMNSLSKDFKRGLFDDAMLHAWCEDEVNQQMLDADIDLIYVSIGAAIARMSDVEGAFNEVAKTNYAKVDPTTGKVKRDENGKIMKPDGWVPPDLSKFI